MMTDIHEPLNEYIKIYKDKFKQVAEETFASLASEAGVNVEENRKTCKKLYESQNVLENSQSNRSMLILFAVLFWIGVAVGVFLMSQMQPLTTEFYTAASAIAVMLIFLLALLHPKIRKLKKLGESLEGEIAVLKEQAWAHMKTLNSLYDWDILARMMSKTIPRLEFDPYFTVQRLEDLKMTYGWDNSFNDGRSVIYSHSGLINGNPFVLCRTREMVMGSKTYYGYKTIHWTESQKGSDGNYHTVTRSQTLCASHTAPFPEYNEKTILIYANTASPDLVFHRKQSDLAGRERSCAFRRKVRKLKRKARNLTDGDFAMLTNEVFEAAFDTSDRNNNQQFSLLFTPLAQESMLALLRDRTVGYGDDFDFIKTRMINAIISDHMQYLELDMNPSRYIHFDFDKAKENFTDLNTNYFRAIYFSFAPLLCVPMYQQIRPHHDIYGHDMQRSSSFWEHEALANFWGQDKFKHPSCVTDCILKTKHREGIKDSSVTVYAHGYRTESRVLNVSVHGRDGHVHNVPVYWDEYLPVIGTGIICMTEDNVTDDSSITHSARLDRINSILNTSGMDVYRRHIASRII